MSDFGFLMENVVGRIGKTLVWCLFAPINLIFNFKKHILNLTICIIAASIFIVRLNMRCIADIVDLIVLILFINFLSRIGQNRGINYYDDIEEVEKKVNK